MGLEIKLRGMEDAEKQMARIERGLKALQNLEGVIFSKLPYAYGIEEGRHRKTGKMARMAGGSFYMRRAVDEVLSGADRDLSEGLEKVTAPGPWVVRRLALWARRLARANVPRGPRKKSHSYRLSKSIKYKVRRK
jgi:hypothetical protein